MRPRTQSLLAATLASGPPHCHACAGQARCSTCRVLVIDGLKSFDSRSPREAELATHRRGPDTVWLACQRRTTGPARARRLVHDAIDADPAWGETDSRPSAEEEQIGLLFRDISDAPGVHPGKAFRPEVRQGWRDVLDPIRRAMPSGLAADPGAPSRIDHR